MKEMRSWLEGERVGKYHTMFSDSMKEMMKDIANKMDNYLDL